MGYQDNEKARRRFKYIVIFYVLGHAVCAVLAYTLPKAVRNGIIVLAGTFIALCIAAAMWHAVWNAHKKAQKANKNIAKEYHEWENMKGVHDEEERNERVK